MKNFWKITIGVVLAIVLSVGVFIFGSTEVKAAESGVEGNCNWTIDDNGLLTISPIEGTDGQLPAYNPGASGSGAGMVRPAWYNKTTVKSVYVAPGVKANEKSYCLFGYLKRCTSMDVSNLDVSAVKDASYMFAYANALPSLDLTGWNTSNFQNMGLMFYECSKLTTLDLSMLDVSSVTSLAGTFSRCTVLTSVNTTGWDTSNVTNMSSTFRTCNALKTIDLRHWNTGSVITMSGMFSESPQLRTVNVTGWDTSHVTDMSYMFSQTGIGTLNLSSWDVSSVTTMDCMFQACNLNTGFKAEGWNTSNVKNMHRMFARGSNSGGNYLYVNDNGMDGWDVSGVTNMSEMFYGANITSYYGGRDPSLSWNMASVTNMEYMFYNCSLSRVDLSGCSAPNVKYLAWAFVGAGNVDISWLDTSNVLSFGSCLIGYDSTSSTVTSFVLGPNFKFTGKGTASPAVIKKQVNETDTNQYMWIRDDGSYGPYTLAELQTNYTSAMAGKWMLTAGPILVIDDSGVGHIIQPEYKSTQGNSTTPVTINDINGVSYTGKTCALNRDTLGQTWSTLANTVITLVVEDGVSCKTPNFGNYPNCISMDITKLNSTGMTTCVNMFKGDAALTEIIGLENLDTSAVTSTNSMFYGCSSLEYLNLLEFNTQNVTNMGSMFNNCSSLKMLDLGENFSFKGNNISYTSSRATPPTPSGDDYTGKWIREDTAYGPWSPTQLRDNYNGPMHNGLWKWEERAVRYTIKFEAPEGASGSMAPVEVKASEAFELPECKFAIFGQNFDHWDDGRGGRAVYTNMATIPANTYAIGDVVTLTAVFVPRDTSVTMQDGTFEFTIRGGEKATFKGIPAGTSYQVYELTPDGWVLVQQENTTGIIQPLQESAAKFWNQYIPGITTIQFSGTKLLDGKPAEESSFNFELIETTSGANGSVTIMNGDATQDTMFPIQTSVIEGGFIQFPILVYDEEGTHTYEIREVNPNDDTIDYDTHVETVAVVVTDDGHGNLTCEATYDEDGIHFINTSRPGGLKITKDAVNGSDANSEDTFTFEIEFANPNGMPFDEEIYWYIEGENNGD